MEIQSVMLIFSTPLLAPLYLLSSSLPRPFPAWVSIYRSDTLCIWPDSEPPKLLYHPKQNLGREGASDTCRQVPLLDNFKKPTFRVWCLYRYLVHARPPPPHASLFAFLLPLCRTFPLEELIMFPNTWNLSLCGVTLLQSWCSKCH